MNWFDKLSEIIGWLIIVLSPLLVGLAIGGLIYLYSPNTAGMVLATLSSAIGLLVGIVWATRVKMKYGTIWFLSRNSATTELDDLHSSNEKTIKNSNSR